MPDETSSQTPGESPSPFDQLLAESSGKLTDIIPKAPLSFRFIWESLAYSARITEHEGGHRLLLLADMGPLPYSSETPAYRERLMGLLSWDCDQETFKFVFDPEKRTIYLMMDGNMGPDITGTGIISEIITTIIKGKPFIALAREIGWTHPEDPSPVNVNYVPADMLP